MKLKNKFALPASISLTALFLFFGIFMITNQRKLEESRLAQKVEINTKLIALTNVTNIWNFADDDMISNMQSFLQDREIVKITIRDSEGNDLQSFIQEDTEAYEKLSDDLKIVTTMEMIKDDSKLGDAEVEFSKFYVEQKLKGIKNTFVVAIVIIIILNIISLVITSSIVTRPLVGMLKVLEKVSNKDLTQFLTVKTKDEIATVGHSINEVVGILKDSVFEINTKSNSLKEIAEDLGSASEETAETSKNMVTVVEDIREKVGATVEDIGDINSKMEKLESFLQQNEENSNVTYQKTMGTIENVDQGVEIVSGVTASMKKVTKQVNDSKDTIVNLAQLLEKIDNFTKVITDISSQTNLLALNAAIEAARAGESGKGFAVVASEVKNLAEESNKAAEEIGSMVKNIKEETHRSVEMMNLTNKQVMESSDSLEKTKAVLQDIQTDSRAMGGSIKEITESLVLQNNNQNEIKKDIEGILGILEENNREIKDIVENIKDQITASEIVAERASDVIDNAEELSVLVKQFKLE